MAAPLRNRSERGSIMCSRIALLVVQQPVDVVLPVFRGGGWTGFACLTVSCSSSPSIGGGFCFMDWASSPRSSETTTARLEPDRHNRRKLVKHRSRETAA